MMKYINIILLIAIFSATAFAQGGSGHVGGGGDANERRVYDIRDDLLSWINAGGAKALYLGLFHMRITKLKMKSVLSSKTIEVSFTDQNVLVDGVEKTCRGIDWNVSTNDQL